VYPEARVNSQSQSQQRQGCTELYYGLFICNTSPSGCSRQPVRGRACVATCMCWVFSVATTTPSFFEELCTTESLM
jgi:hypothetical protein